MNKKEMAAYDKERILMYVIRELCQALHLSKNGINGIGGINVVGGFSSRDEIKKGDLVVCVTSRGHHSFLVGFAVHDYIGNHELKIREIGTNNVCHMYNESFFAIRGLDESRLITGYAKQFETKALKAWRRLSDGLSINSYLHVFSHIEHHEDGKATVWIREKWGGINAPSKPYGIDIEYKHNSTIKSIEQSLADGGFGLREFEIDYEKWDEKIIKDFAYKVDWARKNNSDVFEMQHNKNNCGACRYLQTSGQSVSAPDNPQITFLHYGIEKDSTEKYFNNDYHVFKKTLQPGWVR